METLKWQEQLHYNQQTQQNYNGKGIGSLCLEDEPILVEHDEAPEVKDVVVPEASMNKTNRNAELDLEPIERPSNCPNKGNELSHNTSVDENTISSYKN